MGFIAEFIYRTKTTTLLFDSSMFVQNGVIYAGWLSQTISRC